jgi:hypothetical protein
MSARNCINMHFFMGRPYAGKNSLFLKKSNARFFQKQAVFFRGHFPCRKMHIYAKREETSSPSKGRDANQKQPTFF